VVDAHVKTCFGCIFLPDIPWDLVAERQPELALLKCDAPALPSDGSRRDSTRVVANHSTGNATTATAVSPTVVQFLSWSSDTTLKYVQLSLYNIMMSFYFIYIYSIFRRLFSSFNATGNGVYLYPDG